MITTHHFSLLAFGFSNLAMLGWLAAAAAPLAIHLWSRRRYRQVSWAAVTFLLAAMRRSARRMQIQQWLLLAVRTAIIVLVVLAVAEPYGTSTLAGRLAGTPAHKVIVIDDSYSMAYRVHETSNFKRAKQLAAQLVRDSGAADTFTLICMARPARTIVGREVVDHAAVISLIDALSQTDTGADLSSTLSLVEESMDDPIDRRGISARREAYFFTDLQRETWGDVARSNAPRGDDIVRNDDPAQRLAALARRVACVVVDLGPSAATNLAVTRLATTDPFVTTVGEMQFEATLHQFGDEPRHDCGVELLVDGVPVGEQTIDVPAGADAAVRFTQRFRTPGRHTLAVRAAGDALEVDNTRWLVVPVRERVRVLCVAGKPDAARYVADALAPDPNDSSPLRPVVVSDGDLAELELSQFGCVFLCNVAQFTPGEADRLARYAAAGGGIVLFLGDRVRPDAYNALAKLSPARIGSLVNEPSYQLDPLDYRHPIVSVFRGRERAGLLTTPVARYFRLEVLADRANVEVAAALPGGDPFIVTAALGRGRVVLVATDGSLASVDPATDEPWTLWPTWPSFLPMVREILAYAVSGARGGWERPIGSPLLFPAGGVVDVTRPDGGTDAIRVADRTGGRATSYNATDLAGIYSARPSSAAEPLLFAVNLDTRESDLGKAETQNLPSGVVVRDMPQMPGGTTASGLTLRSGWQPLLLWTALALVLAESLMAWQFGRGH